MERVVYFLADPLRHLRERIALAHLFDQFAQQLVLLISLAEKAAVKPVAQVVAVGQTERDGGERRSVKPERVAEKQFGERAVAVEINGERQPDQRQRQQQAQRVLCQQVLQAAANDEADGNHLMAHDGVGDSEGRQQQRQHQSDGQPEKLIEGQRRAGQQFLPQHHRQT